MPETRELVDLFVDAWKLFVRQVPGGSVTERNGVVAALGNVPLPFLNFCLQSEPVEDLASFRAWLTEAKRMASPEHGTIFPVCDAWLPSGWQDELAGAGMMIGIQSTGMATDELEPPRRPLPQLDIRLVDDAETVSDLTRLNAAAYGMPAELFDSVSHLGFSGEPGYGFVGYLEAGRPAACSVALPVNGTVYVAFVATHPDLQRRGYAETVMRHSIAACSEATGLTRTTLHASEAGYSLYESMGYRPGSRFPMLMMEH